MPVFLKDVNIAIFTAPKVASTSIKRLAYSLEKKLEIDDQPVFENGKRVRFHHLYKSKPFSRLDLAPYAEAKRFALVRSPLSRVVSCYKNRVLGMKDLEADATRAAIAAAGVPPVPSLQDFVDHLPIYIESSPEIRWHLRLLTLFFGDDAGYYKRVFRFDEIDSLRNLLSEAYGRPLDLPHVNKSRNPSGQLTLTEANRAMLHGVFKADYEAFSPWFGGGHGADSFGQDDGAL